MILQVWRPGHWSTWMALVDSYHASSQTMKWTFGGFQDARGATKGAEWYVENVREELDHPNEFFYDPKTQQVLSPPSFWMCTMKKCALSSFN
jgi:hypothetical protein